MVRQRLTELRHHGGAAFLVTLALAGLLLSVATVPHMHVGAEPGLYNQEHDHSYLAALGGVAPLVQAVGAVAPVVVVAAALAPSAPVLVSRPGRHPDPRAPPLR
jgi:membrane associated rhomboid family serine protease